MTREEFQDRAEGETDPLDDGATEGDDPRFGGSRRLGYGSDLSPFSGVMVALVLVGMGIYAISAGLDLNQFDDLVRTNLAKGWWDHPFFLPRDMYWLPIPYLFRGVFLIPFKAVIGHNPAILLFCSRLPTLIFMWGAWRALAGAVRSLGGDKRALTIFTVAFLYNYGTFEFSSTTMSEPDSLLAVAAALAILVEAEALGEFGNRRAWALGGALGLACLMRYENWSISAAIVFCAMLRHGRGLCPRGRLGLTLPAFVIAAWMALCLNRVGDAFTFLKQGAAYVDALGTDRVLARSIKAVFKIQPLLAPLGLVAAGSFMARRLRRPAAWWVALVVALVTAWTCFKLYKIATFTRYAWELYVFIWVAAAPELQDWLDRFSGRLTDRWENAEAWLVQGLSLCSVAALAFIVSRQSPYIPAEMRRFTGSINAWMGGGGSILLREGAAPENAFELQTFRALMDATRLIDCQWVQGCDRLGAEELRRYDFRLAIAKERPGDFAVLEPPIASTENGWRAWRIDPDQPGAESVGAERP